MDDSYKVKIGIIGGSGFDNPHLLEYRHKRRIQTPYGDPSDMLYEGHYKKVPCVILARHGWKHQLQPSDVNYRANIWALKSVGCTHILATTATGSLQEEYRPGDFVILDDFIDRTWGRPSTFYDSTENFRKGVCHMPMWPAFCDKSRQALLKAAGDHNLRCHDKGTVVVIQGPRFSSRAESRMHRQWGAHLVNMTTLPEVTLAKEAGMSYAAVALVTDYDCWRAGAESVSVDQVMATFKQNVQHFTSIVLGAVRIIAQHDDLGYLDDLKDVVKNAVMLKE